MKLVPKSYGSDPNAQPVACEWLQMAQRTGSSTLAVGQKNRKNVTFPIEISLSEIMVDRQKLCCDGARCDRTQALRAGNCGREGKPAVTLRSIGDGVITTDVQGKIVMINNAGETLTGWSSREAIGQPLKEQYVLVQWKLLELRTSST